MKKIQVSVLLMLSLQSMICSAQESQHNVKLERQAMINNAVHDFPYLTQGFDFLHRQHLEDTTFHDFLEQHISDNKDMNYDQVIIKAEKVLTDNMKDTFLKTLNSSLFTMQSLSKYNDPIFQYVMTHKDDDIVRNWLHEWSTTVDSFGNTPLHMAALNNNIEVTRILLNVDANINCQNKINNTPLHNAVWNDSTEVVHILIGSGADLNIQGNNGRTPLYIAAFNNNIKISRMLIDAKAKLDIQNNNGETALYAAVFGNYIEIAQLLIDAKANLNIENKEGETPLYLAAGYNYIEITQLLIKEGVNLNHQNKEDGNTALHMVAKKNNRKIALILINAGADVNIKNNKGETAVALAKTPEIKTVFQQITNSSQDAGCTVS